MLLLRFWFLQDLQLATMLANTAGPFFAIGISRSSVSASESQYAHLLFISVLICSSVISILVLCFLARCRSCRIQLLRVVVAMVCTLENRYYLGLIICTVLRFL